MYSTNSGFAVTTDGNLLSSSRSFQVLDVDNDFAGMDTYYCISNATNEIGNFTAEELKDSMEKYADTDENGKLKVPGNGYPYQTLLITTLSPDGNYLLVYGQCVTEQNTYNKLYLIRLQDLAIREIKGLDADSIINDTAELRFSVGIVWNTDDLIINTKDGIKTYRFE